MDANYFSHLTTVTFDERTVSVDQMREALGNQGFHVQGEPTYLD